MAIKNTSTGPGLRVFGLVATSQASISDLNVQSSLATEPSLIVKRDVVGNMSIGVAEFIGNSVVSGAMLEFSGPCAFISITSVVLTTVANTDYAIRVQVGLETRNIPLFKDAAIIGAAAMP